MNKKIIPLLLSLSFILTACGGGTTEPPHPKQTKIFHRILLPSTANPEDFKDAPEYNLYMSSYAGTDEPVESVNIQSKFSGDAILGVGNTKLIGFDKTKEYVDAADPKKFKYSYIYDEIFWVDGKIQIGKDEDKIMELARYSKSKGIKPGISIMPYVIFDDNFKMKDINSLDVLAIDIYPSIMPIKETKGCKYSENIYTSLLYCSQKKLRDLGYTGEIWYVYQAFGIHGEDLAESIERFNLQKKTIEDAPKLGIDGIIPFGYYLAQEAVDSEPILYQGYKSAIDSYVRY